MTPFNQFDETLHEHGALQALDQLADYFVRQERFHELFEVRKMQLRWRLELPIHQWQPIDELSESTGKKLEAGLLEACREVGERWFACGNVHAGWQYLQPVGDNALVRQLLEQCEVTDENAEAIVDVAIGQAIAPEFGFQIVLDRYGTCTAITTYESQLGGQPISVRRGPAKQLVRHVYQELMERVSQSIAEREPDAVTTGLSLRELIADRHWMFEGLGHHIDTTHLASTVKFSRILDEPAAIDQAIELAEYGQKLNPDFHYKDEPPFANIYSDTLAFLSALRHRDVDATLSRLAQQARASLEQDKNIDSAQWYVYLLDQLGRGAEAVDAYFALIQPHLGEAIMVRPIAPDPLTLAKTYQLYERVGRALLEIGDLLGYATCQTISSQNLAATEGIPTSSIGPNE